MIGPRSFTLRAAVLLALASVAIAGPRDAFVPALLPAFAPANLQGPLVWPEEIDRVAVLPTHDATARLPERPLAGFDRAWRSAVQIPQRAERVDVSRQQLSKWFRLRSFDSTSALPAGWATKLADNTGAQAALFIDLTTVELYGPTILGFRVKLVNLADNAIIWMADETYDAADATVAEAVRRYVKRLKEPSRGSDPVSAFNQSPSRFAGFAFTQTLDRLPPRIAKKEP